MGDLQAVVLTAHCYFPTDGWRPLHQPLWNTAWCDTHVHCGQGYCSVDRSTETSTVLLGDWGRKKGKKLRTDYCCRWPSAPCLSHGKVRAVREAQEEFLSGGEGLGQDTAGTVPGVPTPGAGVNTEGVTSLGMPSVQCRNTELSWNELV